MHGDAVSRPRRRQSSYLTSHLFCLCKEVSKYHSKPDVLQQKSIVKWLVLHLFTATTHILCHLDPGRVFRTSFFWIHFNIISITRLVFSLHLFLPRLRMRYLSLLHVLCTSFFISFFTLTLSASCEEWIMVKSARIIKNQAMKMCAKCRCSIHSYPHHRDKIHAAVALPSLLRREKALSPPPGIELLFYGRPSDDVVTVRTEKCRGKNKKGQKYRRYYLRSWK